MISLISILILSHITDPEIINRVDLIEVNQYNCTRGDSGLWQIIFWTDVGDAMRVVSWKQVFPIPGDKLPQLPYKFEHRFRYEYTNHDGAHIVEAPEWILSSSKGDPESVDRTMGDFFRRKILPVRRRKQPTPDYTTINGIFKYWPFNRWILR